MVHASLPDRLADIHVRPSRGLWLLLAADLTRGLAMAVGALMVHRLAPRDGPWWLEGAGAMLGLPWGAGARGGVPAWLPWALGALGLLTAVTTLGCFALSPKAMAWRRRLGLLAVAETLFSGVGGNPRAVLVALWTGAVWVGLLFGGLALSREVVRISGEEGLEADPSRPRL
jgi:hypothetical protein